MEETQAEAKETKPADTKKKVVTSEDKQKYQEEIKQLKGQYADFVAKQGKLEKQMKEDPYHLENYYHLAIANEYLNMVMKSCEMSKVSEKYLKKKNDDFLNDARKKYLNGLIEIEKFVGVFVDTTLNENQEMLNSIRKFDALRLLNLFNKLKDSLAEITNGYGENSKYKWGFVEMESRYISIFKNLIDYRYLERNDPRNPYYAEYTVLLRNLKLYLFQVSNKMREKYMLATKEAVDIKAAINFQEALRKINALLGFQEEAETCKKTIESWKQILESIEKQKKDKKR